MLKIDTLGSSAIARLVMEWTEEIPRPDIVDFIEENRYLPASVTSKPGYMSFDVNPFMVEILQCFDLASPVREVNFMKGVQLTYSTLIECIIMYIMCIAMSQPSMLVTADEGLCKQRFDNNIIPMLIESELMHLIQSHDETSTNKKGLTADAMSWKGGGYMIPNGARSPTKARQNSMMWMMMDELDGWLHKIGNDGCPDGLFTDRCSGYWRLRKIFRGSTPLEKATSKILKRFREGDQREYFVNCLKCGMPQIIKFSGKDSKTGHEFGIKWDYMEGGDETLDINSVRYVCQNPGCGRPHMEEEKGKLIALKNAEWIAQAKPIQPNIRSYHLSALYSPQGMQPWYKSVGVWLAAWDVKKNRLKNINELRRFYNNILGMPFEEQVGGKITFKQVSSHRRRIYRMGEIPNQYALDFSGSKVLFLTCTVDLHKHFAAVMVAGWTCGPSKNTNTACCYVVEYMHIVDDSEEGLEDPDSPVWDTLREIIEEREWTAETGEKYRPAITFIDAGWRQDLAADFCKQWDGGVYPTIGRQRPRKNQKITEFVEWTTQLGSVGYRITVDHYKDRCQPVLRRHWREDAGDQPQFHLNVPVDTDDKHLTELTVETRKEKEDANGIVSYEWHRPSGVKNEMWDCLILAHASVEVLAWQVVMRYFEYEAMDWSQFWEYIEEEKLFFTKG